jgi:hypothetical protein
LISEVLDLRQFCIVLSSQFDMLNLAQVTKRPAFCRRHASVRSVWARAEGGASEKSTASADDSSITAAAKPEEEKKPKMNPDGTYYIDELPVCFPEPNAYETSGASPRTSADHEVEIEVFTF